VKKIDLDLFGKILLLRSFGSLKFNFSKFFKDFFSNLLISKKNINQPEIVLSLNKKPNKIAKYKKNNCQA